MTKKLRSRYARLFCTLMLVMLGSLGIMPATPALASGGNVQIRLYSTSGAMIVRAEVGGYNQNGNYAIWGPYDTSSQEVKTTGWWFGGSGTASYVYLKVRMANGTARSCFQALNLYSWENWKTINVSVDGFTTSSGAPNGQCSQISGF